jgi:hypothetical protein
MARTIPLRTGFAELQFDAAGIVKRLYVFGIA